MKGKKLFAGVISASMVLGTMAFPVFAEATALPTADENGVITLTEDVILSSKIKLNNDLNLNGYTLTIPNGENVIYGTDTKVYGGNIKVEGGTRSGEGIINIGYHGFDADDVEFSNVKLSTGENYVGGCGVIKVFDDASFTFDGGEVNVGENNAEAVIEEIKPSKSIFMGSSPDAGGSITIKNLKVNVDKAEKLVNLISNATVENLTFKGNIQEDMFAAIGNGTVKKSTFTYTNGDEATRAVVNDRTYESKVVFEETTFVDVPEFTSGWMVTDNEDSAVMADPESDLGVDAIPNLTVYKAKVNDEPYETFAAALGAAVDGDTVTLFADIETNAVINMQKAITVDLNGKTITAKNPQFISFWVGKGVTIKNGTIVIDDTSKSEITDETFGNDIGGDVTFENVEIDATNAWRLNLFNVVENSKMTFNNSTVKVGDKVKLIFAGNAGSGAEFEINGGKVDVTGESVVFLHGTSTVTDAEINAPKATILQSYENGGDLSISGSKVVADNAKLGNSNIVISDNSNVRITGEIGMYSDDINPALDANGVSISVTNSTLYAGGIVDGATVETDDDSTLIDRANEIEVDFVQDETTKANEYKIVLKADDKDIYEFVGAQLTFKNESKTLTGEDMDYVIEPIENSNINVVEGLTDDQFAFYLKDGAANKRITAKEIVLGKVVFGQQGTFNFKVTDGVVKTTKYGTHLEEEYTVDGALKLNLENSKIDSTEVKAAERDVVVNIAFNHAIERVNDIKVTIRDSFGNVKTPMVAVAADGTQLPKWNFADVAVGKLTVTLEADGFRKYVYTTNLEDGENALVLNFWNNTLREGEEEAAAIEEGGKKMFNNFVVGDIAMDYIVDKFDLAAVTSYFGKYEITDAETEKYNRYDLNRDGKIDITDVGYVLHNFGF